MTVSLVTGGAGFVGKHLVAALKARGERVRVLDLASGEGPDFMQGSVVDPVAARRAVEGVDFVFHLAGNAQLWARDPSSFQRINTEGTQAMLAAAAGAKVRRFIHCSSLTTLVGRTTPIGPSAADESLRLSPGDMLGTYPRSKLCADLAVEEAAKSGLDAVIGIPTEPLGPGDDGMTPPTRMILDFMRGKTPAFIDCTLNFVPVEDLAAGFIALRDRGKSGERYLLGGENVSMRRLLETVERLTGRRMPKTRLPYGVALLAGAIDTGLVARLTGQAPKAPLTGVRLAGRCVAFSSEKAACELDWRAATRFEDSLARTLEWLDAR